MTGQFWLPLQNPHIEIQLSSMFIQQITEVLSSIGGFTCLVYISSWMHRAFLRLRGRGLAQSIQTVYQGARKWVWGMTLRLPKARKEVDAQVAESLDKLAAKLVPEHTGLQRYTTIPKLSGMEHVRWEDGRVSGAVYHGRDEMAELQTRAYHAFAVANPIHPDVFPGIRKMEAEVVSMVLRMFHAPVHGAGTCMSGGTESILAACLSAREKGSAERGIRNPEMILPSTAHPAFRKAGYYFGIKIHEVECPAPTYQVNTRAVSIAMCNRTLLHVDCCVGSFMAAMLQKAGFDAVPFDFQLPGVTSSSYSVVLYRTSVYVSQGMLGSRAGALIAGCWATMMGQGEAGYLDACREMVGCPRRFETALRSAPLSNDLQAVGKPFSTVVAFTSTTLNLWKLADKLISRGWHLNALQDPPAIHVAFTRPVVKAEAQLLKDLKEPGSEKGTPGGSLALYGVAGSLPNEGVLVQLGKGYLDTLYRA
ncbi:pyridoxal phosphate-dependent transferase [Clohesyomyces aquaticus]|uniref:Pyridoxal phosphate-dependent transferase n=1 Tax=Clohesyomyces aquaticus TaxID=1231657 RepID=A0A1Y1YDT7_9PLEO|nr:pyridoxal phosphate-dependent transferase [Clohesyomyces aquaticus]